MIYSFETRIRYSEAGADGRLGLVKMMDYMQDCCMFHAEDVGVGAFRLREMHHAWVVLSWQVIVDRYPRAFEKIRVSTLGTKAENIFAHRNFLIHDEAGTLIAKANSIWSYVDMDTMRPVSLRKDPDAFMVFGPEEPIEMDYEPRRIDLPKEGGRCMDPIVVGPEMLDSNGHVNNVRYITIAQQALGEKLLPRQLRAEYKLQTYPGDVLTPVAYAPADRSVLELRNAAGKPSVIIEMKI